MRLNWAKLRQKTFPAAFRFDTEDGDDWANLPAVALTEALTAVKRLKAEIEDRKKESGSQRAIDPDFALNLCNYHFRLRRNAQQIAEEGKDSKELRSINRSLENIEELFKKYGIECRDLTGQIYDPLRVEFDPIGEPQAVPGLDHDRIGRCERPAVFINGKLIQKARGLVTRPL